MLLILIIFFTISYFGGLPYNTHTYSRMRYGFLYSSAISAHRLFNQLKYHIYKISTIRFVVQFIPGLCSHVPSKIIISAMMKKSKLRQPQVHEHKNYRWQIHFDHTDKKCFNFLFAATFHVLHCGTCMSYRHRQMLKFNSAKQQQQSNSYETNQ